MSRLIISNQLTEETVEGDGALPLEYRQFLAVIAHRMLWFARDDDVVVLPTQPSEQFIGYVREHMGLSDARPTIVIPPPGRQGSELLYPDRLTNPAFLAELRALVRDKHVDRVFPFYLDDTVLELARALGLSGPYGSLDFLAERGGELVNSKAVFRAIAAGNGVAIPEGRVCTTSVEAAEFAWARLAGGEPIIVKQDLHGGGYGNELLVPADGMSGVGVNSTIVTADRESLAAHLREHWDRYTYGGARPVVVEHYIRDCGQLYVEMLIADAGCELVQYGEMRMKPILNGLVIPPSSADLPDLKDFLAGAERIATAERALGYRGHAAMDAIVTPDGQVLFNELNGRVAGSTHLDVVARRVIGDDYLTERVLISRNRCAWSSFESARATLATHGLAFDQDTRTGVLLPGDDDAPGGPTGQLLVVAKDLPAAQALENAAVAALEAA
jgi:hypothetical protein